MGVKFRPFKVVVNGLSKINKMQEGGWDVKEIRKIGPTALGDSLDSCSYFLCRCIATASTYFFSLPSPPPLMQMLKSAWPNIVPGQLRVRLLISVLQWKPSPRNSLRDRPGFSSESFKVRCGGGGFLRRRRWWEFR